MRKFIFKVLVFSLPILIVSVAFELLIRNIPNDYSYKKEYLDENSEKIETLVLGSSHSFYGIDPRYFSNNTFNAGQISQSLNYDLEILKKYQGEFKSLKTIVLPISYFSFYSSLESGVESWRIKNYMIYYDLNSSESMLDYSEVLSNHVKVMIDKLVSHYGKGDKSIYCSNLGWGTNFKSENALDLLKSGEISAKRHTVLDRESEKVKAEFDKNKLHLKSIIKWSKERNVKVLVLTLPAFKSYREHLDGEQLKKTIDATESICSEFDNCIYNNLLNDTAFVASDYFDADHLSEIGAEKLSRQIDSTISWNNQ